MKQEAHIQLLPEFLIDQIKAGEVIERPSTLIKELLENSIDANSDKIELHIINNGLDHISIIDNGDGINFDELPYAFCRHATSKIQKFNDLYSLDSFGFRGEALASIASIAKVSCFSKKADKAGGKIVFHGGVQQEHFQVDGIKNGTHIIIEDLFFNTPARLKFTRSQTSEKNAIKKIIDSFLVSNPEIEFHIKWDESEKLIYPKQDLISRINKVIGQKRFTEDNSIKFAQEYDEYRVEGIISLLPQKSAISKCQFIFVNHRLIQDKSLHHLIIGSLGHLWSYQQQGAYVVHIKVPPHSLDVNVHPNKIVVKFSETSTVYSLLSSTLKNISIGEENSQFATESINTNFTNKDINLTNNPYIELDESQNNQKINYIDDDFAVIHLESPYLISIKSLFEIYTQDQFSKNTDQTIPLMISLPFKVKKSFIKDFDQLSWEKKGFEFDALDETTLVLRTIPSYLEYLNYKTVVSKLLAQESFKDEIFDNRPHYELIQAVLKRYSTQELIKKNVIRVLSKEFLQSILRDESK